jgi:cyclophilin family peptidyl-prolyl cis-trans isomerase
MTLRTTLALLLAFARAAPAGAQTVPRAEDFPPSDVVFVVEKLGSFRVRLDPSAAPNHCAQFLTLAASGRYRGSTFHRVIPRLVVQAGTLVDEIVPPRRVPEEASSAPPVRGAVAMAWRGCTPGTAETEWFVCLEDLPALERCGTIIGRVVSGMDVVDKIAQSSTNPAAKPLRPIIIQDVRVVDRADTTEASVPKAFG